MIDAAIMRARTNPHAPALISAEAALSWHEFMDTAARLATLLSRRGVRPGQIVAISQEYSPIAQAALTAAIWFRAAASCSFSKLMLESPPFEPDWVVEPALAPERRREGCIVLDAVALARVGSLPPQTEPVDFPSADSVCRMMFSSGTTGTPKAVPFSLRLLTRRMRQAKEAWIPDLPFMSLLGLNSASGFLTFAESLRSGAPYLIPGNAAQNLALARVHGVRALKASPAQLASLANVLEASVDGLPELRVIESAGSALPEALRARLERLTGAGIVNLYGSCEAGTVAIGDRGPRESGHVGRVLSGVQVHIVDDEGRELPGGSEGLLRVKRPGQVEGYYKDHRATSESFVDGWFVPGDVGSIVDGELYLLGRSSEIINAGGVKVLPWEIERRLEELEGIGQVAVFGHTDESGNLVIAAAYTGGSIGAGDDTAPAVQRWTERARVELGAIAPSRWVHVSEIPRNENGKVLRGELARTVRCA